MLTNGPIPKTPPREHERVNRESALSGALEKRGEGEGNGAGLVRAVDSPIAVTG